MPYIRPSTVPHAHAHALPLHATMRTIPLTSNVMCLVAKTHATFTPPAVRLWRLSTHLNTHTTSHRHTSTALHAAPLDVFLDASTDHERLGISQPVATALRTAGFAHPSNVQALAWPALLQMQDVVLAAETGSGKTMAYLAPLLVHLLGFATSSTDPRPAALVLCPNAALCQQVQHVAQVVLDALPSSEHGSLRAAWVGSASLPSPSQRVDLAIATPAALLNILYETGSGCGYVAQCILYKGTFLCLFALLFSPFCCPFLFVALQQTPRCQHPAAAHIPTVKHTTRPDWTPGGLARRMRHVVVDEADMLLGGGFEKATLELLALLRRYDKDVRGLALAEALGMEWGAFKALPRLVLQAGLAGVR